MDGKNGSMRLAAFAGVALLSAAAQAQVTHQQYVQQCQTELGFRPEEIRNFKCDDGSLFAGTNIANSVINDRVVYKKVNDNVDLTVACRWLNNFEGGPSTRAGSVELIIHNRVNGNTCFFSAKDQFGDVLNPVSADIVSPTAGNAANYWLSPAELNARTLPSDQNKPFDPATFPRDSSPRQPLQCVGCHVAGPYIASPDIAPHLARFGLLNDGHDTVANMTPSRRYHAVGSNAWNDPTSGSHPFKNWDNLIYRNMVDEFTNGTPNRVPDGKPDVDCSGACHSIGRNSVIGSLYTVRGGIERLLPSIAVDIKLVGAPNYLMPPRDDASPWRWINRDNVGADQVEIETFTASKTQFPVLEYCGKPTGLEAHVVGSHITFNTNEMGLVPDKLRAFNLRDGLLCLNSDQPAGQRCHDYRVSYICNNPGSLFTPWYNRDQIADDGDHEELSRSLADARAYCGADPVGIKAQVLANGIPMVEFEGPNDRLAQFIPSGLVCRNSDQGSGQKCASYVVRYTGCQPKSEANLARVKNAWVNPPTFTDRFLTTTNNVNGAETRAQGGNFQYPSQDWSIEAVPGGNTVRLRDTWSGKYLTASGNNDQAAVVVNDSNATLMRQQWVVETITNSSEVRFRNVGSSRYLTVGNYQGDPYYAPILSQSLSNQNWASQRWIIN